ncbi:MAG TPA: Ig-like domain-containing protein, partial [Gammaproteobacteria bacterium]
QGATYVLTGNPNDVLSGNQFPLEKIPGALHAFSALQLVKVPLFMNAPGVERDRYPISITARDKVGNQSTAAIDIAVVNDQIPKIVEMRTEKSFYLPRDPMLLDVQARDDRAVSQLKATYFLDGGSTPVLTQTKGSAQGLIPAANVQATFQLNLAELNLSNAQHSLRVELIATDDRNQNSAAVPNVSVRTFDIRPDQTAPLLGISAPIQGSTLYYNEQVRVDWKAQDDSQLQQVRFSVNSAQVHQRALNTTTAEGNFTIRVPSQDDELLITATIEDIYGNTASTNWRFSLQGDQPPVVSIRSPAAGSRLVEGEAFALAAQVSDNRRVTGVEFLIRVNAAETVIKTYGGNELLALLNAGQFLTASMRVPHRPENSTVVVGVRATDDAGLVTFAPLDLTILDDEEAPLLSMQKPAQSLELMPGDRFEIQGLGEDNLYIAQIDPVLVNANGDVLPISWETFARKDRLEQRTIPNPITFGTLIVGERFHTQFNAQIRLLDSFTSLAGQTLRFSLRAKDHGINTFETPQIEIRVLADTEAPKIVISQPQAKLVQWTEARSSIQITDNQRLSSARAYLLGSETSPLQVKTSINAAAVDLNPLINLGVYAAGDTFTLVVEATDVSGNTATQSRLVTIMPDLPPVLSIIDQHPPVGQHIKGGLAFQQIEMKDDFLPTGMIRYFPVYTSLRGVTAGGARVPTGQIAQIGAPA